MAFLGPLLASVLPMALPILGRAVSGALGGVAQAVQRGGKGIDVLKGAGVGALSGLVGQGDQQERIEPRPVYDAPEHQMAEPRPIRHKTAKVKLPKLVQHKKKKKAGRR